MACVCIHKATDAHLPDDSLLLVISSLESGLVADGSTLHQWAAENRCEVLFSRWGSLTKASQHLAEPGNNTTGEETTYM